MIIKTLDMYEYSPPRKIKINGVKCVEIDGGKLYEMATFGEPAKTAQAPSKIEKQSAKRGKK